MAININFGDSILGSINLLGTEIEYELTADIGDLLTLHLTELTAALEPRIKIFTPDNSILVDQQAFNSIFIDNLELPEAGNYTILVMDEIGDDTGDYTLSLQRTNNPANPIHLSYGDNVSGTISPGTELDTYRLIAEAGDLLTLQLTELTAALEPEIRIYNPDGSLLLAQQAFRSVFLDNLELPEAGNYTILVMDEIGDDTGDYNLSLQRTNNPANPIPLSYGDNVAGTISPDTELDTYRLIAEAGDLLTLQLTELTAALEPEIRIYNPDGSLLLAQQAFRSVFLDNLALPQAGNYTILVMDEIGDDTGDYNLSLQRTNNPANPIPLSYGDNVSGTISPGTELDTYRLIAEAGDLLTLQLTELTVALEPEIRIYNPDGSLLLAQQAFRSVFLDNLELPEAGNYTILIMDEIGDDTGDYNLSLQRTNDPEVSTPLEPGTTQTGSIAPGTELQTYVFSGSENDQLSFQLTDLSASLEPEVRIYQPDGSLFLTQQSFGTITISNEILPDTGIYTILVMDDVGNDTGTFSFDFDLTSQDIPPINDNIIGNASSNILDGKIGNDRIAARGGEDIVFGSSGNDVLRGESGSDFLDGGTGNDIILAAGGNDFLQGHSGNDSLNGGSGVDTIVGWNGNDTAIGGSGNDLIFGNLGNDSLSGGNGNDTLDADDGADTVSGNNGNDLLRGGNGNDQIQGGAGIDILDGGNGNDTLLGGDGRDRLIGRAGSDIISGGADNDTIISGSGSDQLTGGSGRDRFNLGSINQSRLAQLDQILDLAIGMDVINSPIAVSAANLSQLGSIFALSQVGIQNRLTSEVFQANSAATFTFNSRTFLALNDDIAGYKAQGDGLIEITGFTGNLNNLRIV